MRIPRIYHPGALASGERICLDDSAANHVVRVLRLRPGATLRLFNGEGGEYVATLSDIGKRHVEVTIGPHHAIEVESPLAITLAQGVAKGERMDYVVQKAVELGVARIVPVISEHCAVNLSSDRQDKRLRHWQAVAISACEQCGRNTVPQIVAPVPLDTWLARTDDALRLVLDPRAEAGMAHLKPTGSALTLLIGPEGGLSDGEITRATAHGYCGIRLGPRILRTETATVAAITLVQARWGDLA